MSNDEIVKFVNENTDWDDLTEVSTKQVADHFGVTTEKAYKALVALSDKKGGSRRITWLAPVNQMNMQCCGWIRNAE